MAISLLISLVDKTTLLKTDSINISDDLNSRNTCSFTLVDTTGVYRPSIGETVVILEGATRRFAGTIDDTNEVALDGNNTLAIDVDCVDYNQIPDRHLVARVYEDKTLKYIVEDIIAQDLTNESITSANVETGQTIEKAVFNYGTATECFNELSELTGYAWYIDYNKDMHFFARETNTAPFSLTDTSGNFRNMKVRRTREQYRNTQYLRAGTDITNSRTETFKGDGQTRTFTTAYPIAKVPTNITISASTSTQTIGIRGVDTGKDWYWNKGEPVLNQDDTATLISLTGTVSITYQGMFPLFLMSQDTDEVTTRAAAEGGSGIYEAIEEDANINDRDLAGVKADGILRRLGSIPVIVEFETDTAGLAAGQLISINITRHGINSTYLIDSVRVTDIKGQFLRYQVRALSGESLGSWETFFKTLATTGKKYVIRDNEVLGILRRLTDTATVTDTVASSTYSPVRFQVGEMFYDNNGCIAEVLS